MQYAYGSIDYVMNQTKKRWYTRLKHVLILALFIFGFAAPTIQLFMPQTAYAEDLPDPLEFCKTQQSYTQRCTFLDITGRKNITASSTWTVEKEVLSTLYLRALLACMKDGGGFQWHDTAQAQYLADYNEWNDAGGGRIIRGNYNVGSLIDTEDNGHLNCENEDKGWVEKAFSLWEINDPITAACIIGWYRYDIDTTPEGTFFPTTKSSYTDCLDSSKGSQFTSKISRQQTAANGSHFYTTTELLDEGTILNRLFAARGITIGLDDAHKYVLYLNTLKLNSANDVGCHAVDMGLKSAASPALQDLLSGDDYVTVNIVSGSGDTTTIAEHIFQLKDGKKKDTTVAVATYLEGRDLYTGSSPERSPSADGKNTCGNIANVANSYAPSFYSAVKDSKMTAEDANSLSDACLPTDPSCLQTSTQCTVEGSGWFLCLILNGIGGMNDLMYGIVESILLLNPLQTEENGNPSNIYVAWQRIRDIANVLLVVVFIIVIFSQITNIGVTNYGIKKTLPRIIIVAIAINLSFFAMMIAVDLVNVIGKSLHDLLVSLAPNITASGIDDSNVGSSYAAMITTIITVAGTVTIAGMVVGASALAWMALPFIVVAGLALLAAMLTLFIRNALVIVLVVLAPVAFAAFLLPNTQPLFDRWRKTLFGMLFLYPTAALLFGGAKFAANIMAGSGQPLAGFIAIITMAVPLGMLPWLAASSGGILAAVGGKLQGLAQKARSPLQNWTSKRAEQAKLGYQAGTRNAFGLRRRTPRDATGGRGNRRNLAELTAQNAAKREAENKANSESINNSSRAAELRRSTTGRGRRGGNVYDQQQTEASRGAMLDESYKTRSDQRRATIGTPDNQYAMEANRQNVIGEKARSDLGRQQKRDIAGSAVLTQAVQDSKKYNEESKTLDLEQDRIFAISKNTDAGLQALGDRQHDAQKDIDEAKGIGDERQVLRIRNNAPSSTSGIGLRDQAANMALVQEQIKASQLNIDRNIKDSGILNAAMQEQKDENLKIKAHDDEQQAVFDQRVLRDRDAAGNPGELLQAAERIDTAARSSSRDQAGLKLRMDRRANQDGTLESDLRQSEEDAKFKSEVLEGENRKDFEERKATELSAEENKRRADEDATQTARDEQQRGYSQRIDEDQNLRERAGGNINPEEGQIKAAARAASAEDKIEKDTVAAGQKLGGKTSEQAYQGDMRVDEAGQLELDSEDPQLITDILERTGVIEAGDIPRQPDGSIASADIEAWLTSNPQTAAGVGLAVDPASGAPRMLTSDRDILTAAGRRARIIGDNDTIDNANPGLIPALRRVQGFTADTQRGGTSTIFGVQATATNLAQGKRLTAQGLMEMFAGLPPLPDRTTDPAGWQRELESRSQAVTEINNAAEAAGLPHMSKNRLRPDGSLEIGGEKGGVAGMVTDMFQTSTPITKHMLQDLSVVQNPDGTQVVVGDEIARQFFDLMTDPARQVQYQRSVRSMNYETLDVLAGRLAAVSGGNRDTILTQLRTDSGQAQKDFTT